MTKRIFTLLLAAILVLGSFSGCGKEQPQQTQPPEEAADYPYRFVYEPSQPVALSTLSAGQSLQSKVSSAPARKELTLIVYMVGSNLETDAAAASRDIMEMLGAGLDTSRYNLLIFTGGSKSWALDIPSDVNTLWTLTPDGTSLTAVAATEQVVNMGDGAVFLDFLNFGYTNYPAESYGLICWDHGGGPLGGFGNDELFEYDPLSLQEMEAALSQSPFAQEKLAFYGFDACLMSCVEVATMVSKYSRYMVASQELEPGTGWDYSFLTTLNTGTVEDMAAKILEAYEASMLESRWKPSYTLAWLDLEQIGTLNESLDGLFETMAQDLIDGNFDAIARSRNNTQRFGLAGFSTMEDTLDLVDILDTARELGSDYSAETDALSQALDKAVLAQVSNIEDTCGLSMYYPYDNKDQFLSGGSTISFEHNGSMGYRNYMEGFSGIWLYDQPAEKWLQLQQTREEEDILITLTEEQASRVGSAYYTIYYYDPETETYQPILQDCRVDPEGDTIRIPKDPEIFQLSSDEGFEAYTWPMAQMGSQNGQDTYVTILGCLLTSDDAIIGGLEAIQMVVTDGDHPEIQSISSREETVNILGKQDINTDLWGIMAYAYYRYYPTHDQDGMLLPGTQWSTDGYFGFYMVTYDKEFWFSKKPLSQLEGDYYYQLVLEDTRGNVISTQLDVLKEDTSYTEETVPTENGTMTFRVYEDHARLHSYDGADKTLIIPETAGGQPVTIISPGAVSSWDLTTVQLPETLLKIEYNAFSCYNLSSVNFPESLERIGLSAFSYSDLTEIQLGPNVKSIGDKAFAGTGITEITLPAGLEVLGESVFADCDYLTQIHIPEGNPKYKSIDGILFSADGKTLLTYPVGRTGSYTVPQGVEAIGPGAFRGATGLTGVTFPEGLKVIDRLAFLNVPGLTALDFPESLEIIGEAAFGHSIDINYNHSTAVSTIRIGKNVTNIGTDAFLSYITKEFVVDPENATYCSKNSCLLNKNGTRLYQAPYGYEGKLVVPDGVSYVDWHAFENCSGITELVFPDSVTNINSAAMIPVNLEKVYLGKGLQNIVSYPNHVEMTISADNPYFTMVGKNIYSKDGKTLYFYREDGEAFAIPEGVEIINVNAFPSQGYSNAILRQITVPASVTDIPVGTFSDLAALEEIIVHPDNTHYLSENGLLYTADGTKLLAAPRTSATPIVVRDGTIEICEDAIGCLYDYHVNELIIPEGVQIIREGNFEYGSRSYDQEPLILHLPASLTNLFPEFLSGLHDPEDVIVYCPAGSAADTLARSRGFEVVNP